jgi:hypothetical protein
MTISQQRKAVGQNPLCMTSDVVRDAVGRTDASLKY